MDEPDYEIVEAFDEDGRHVTRIVHHDPPATDMTLIATAELDALRQEVARLRAGEADQPAAESVQPTPAQWIRRWNRGTPEQRLAMADQILRNAQAAHHCGMAHGLRAQLDGEDTNRG